MERLKRFITAYVRAGQKVLLTVMLVLLYLVGFSATYLFLLAFNRDLLFAGRGRGAGAWLPATGYDVSLDECAYPS